MDDARDARDQRKRLVRWPQLVVVTVRSNDDRRGQREQGGRPRLRTPPRWIHRWPAPAPHAAGLAGQRHASPLLARNLPNPGAARRGRYVGPRTPTGASSPATGDVHRRPRSPRPRPLGRSSVSVLPVRWRFAFPARPIAGHAVIRRTAGRPEELAPIMAGCALASSSSQRRGAKHPQPLKCGFSSSRRLLGTSARAAQRLRCLGPRLRP